MIAADDDTEKSMMDMARAERAELAAFLTTLTLQQWETPSLCAGWSVKEVVAHMISYEDLGVFGLLKRFAKGRIVRANEVGVDARPPLQPTLSPGPRRLHTPGRRVLCSPAPR